MWPITIFYIFSFQGRCNREKPPCKYFHPPQHLKDQLLINGRNHLALKNALMQQMGMAPNGQPIITSQLQPMVSFSFPTSQSFAYAVCLRNLLNKNSTKPPTEFRSYMNSIKCKTEKGKQ
jgi:hypothetical protein